MSDKRSEFKLSETDSAALDRLIEQRAGGDVADGQQESGVEGVANLLDAYPEPKLPEGLVADVLDRVHGLNATDARGEDVDQVSGRTFKFSSWQFRDIAGIAAVLLIGVSLMIPVINDYSRQSRRQSDMARLGRAGHGIAGYAADYETTLPRQEVLGKRWDQIGKKASESNSANLYLLVSGGYNDLEDLTSVENPDGVKTLPKGAKDWQNYDQVSFSYLNQFGRQAIRLDSVKEQLVLIANKNPHFKQVDGKLVFDAQPIHNLFYGGNGQLMLTFRGDVLFNKQQKLKNGDHIYLIDRKGGELRSYDGTEVPDSINDNHLIP